MASPCRLDPRDGYQSISLTLGQDVSAPVPQRHMSPRALWIGAIILVLGLSNFVGFWDGSSKAETHAIIPQGSALVARVARTAANKRVSSETLERRPQAHEQARQAAPGPEQTAFPSQKPLSVLPHSSSQPPISVSSDPVASHLPSIALFSWLGAWSGLALFGWHAKADAGKPPRTPANRAIWLGLALTLGPAFLLAFAHAPAFAATVDAAAAPALTAGEVFAKALKRAVGGGSAGAAAAVLQVLTLMWLRTAMNYQYRFGGTMTGTIQRLWGEGGVRRLYQGLPYALVQGPLSRFGDTAASVGVLALFAAATVPGDVPIAAQTLVASAAAGAWRIILTPLDTLKTAVQVNGPDGWRILKARMAEEGPRTMYNGAVASAFATALGHYPWFLTYNMLAADLPDVQTVMGLGGVFAAASPLFLELVRSAIIGFAASSVSDCVSNSARVLKTTKQTAERPVSYLEALSMVLEKDGVRGLLGRGLRTRLVCNGLQGTFFTVLWRYLQTVWG